MPQDGMLKTVALALRVLGLVASAAIALSALYAYWHHGVRPDATEVRDLWLLVAFEVAVVTFGAAIVLQRLAMRPAKEVPVVPPGFAH